MPRRALLLALVAFGIVGAPGVAPADDHRPPMALLRIHGFPQRGRVTEVDWIAKRDGECLTKQRRKDLRFGPPVRVDIGHYDGKLRILTAHRPRLEIVSWILLDGSKKPVGPPEQITFELKRLGRNGRTIAWEALFRMTVLQHRYFAVTGRWPDQEGCGGDQRVLWTYHLQGL